MIVRGRPTNEHYLQELGQIHQDSRLAASTYKNGFYLDKVIYAQKREFKIHVTLLAKDLAATQEIPAARSTWTRFRTANEEMKLFEQAVKNINGIMCEEGEKQLSFSRFPSYSNEQNILRNEKGRLSCSQITISEKIDFKSSDTKNQEISQKVQDLAEKCVRGRL